jgi:4-carboxymuconolactone decarboxylase
MENGGPPRAVTMAQAMAATPASACNQQEPKMAAPPSARRDRIKPHFGKLVEMTNEYVYGDVWERPQLSKRDRSLVTIAALVALGWEDQLNSHIGRGLGNGLTQEEIAEIITHLSMYAGWPAAMTASHVAVDVFESKKD